MKRLFFPFLLIGVIFSINSQTKREIANVYFKKSREALKSINYPLALSNFDKALKYVDTISKAKNAELGTLINYELKNYDSAKQFAKQFFALNKNKSSERYNDMLVLYVEVEERINKIEEKKRLEEEKKVAREKGLKKIDSLKKNWKLQEKKFILDVDSLYKFNKNRFALFSKDKKYGIINDRGEILLDAEKYGYGVGFDSYFLLTDKRKEPTKIYCYDSNNKKEIVLPAVSEFDEKSNYYDQIMPPRGNGLLIAYPSNSVKTLIYNLKEKEYIRIPNLQDLLKDLKKSEKIDKYNKKKRTVKVNKNWYRFGSDLGGGIYSLYDIEINKIAGFLMTNTGGNPVVVESSGNLFLGAFYNNKSQGLQNDKTIWVNDIGREGEPPNNEDGKYRGTVSVKKVDKGGYKLIEDGSVFLKDKKMEPLVNFLKRNNANLTLLKQK